MKSPLDWLTELQADIQAIWEKDPAAESWLEVLSCYPGLHAIAMHRVAHALHQAAVPVVPRALSHLNRFLTGIEIHPGAKLGRGVFIDHGMGVVIGETAEVGDNVLIYQGVTLGGTSLEKKKRHPTIGKNVVIGAGAKVLGAIEIGDNSYVGAGSVVTKAVPANATVVGIPARVTALEGQKVPSQDLQHDRMPDPVMGILSVMQDRLSHLEAEVDRVRQENREIRRKAQES